MKRSILAAAIAAVLGTAAPAWSAGPLQLAHSEPAHTGHHAPQALSLDEGRKWSTDEALRRHMEAIRAAVAQQRDSIYEGTLMPAEARSLGQSIEARVAAILTDCKLEPRADANLHLIVAQLVDAADTLQGRKGVQLARGGIKATRAVQMYATYFDHPDWNPVY